MDGCSITHYAVGWDETFLTMQCESCGKPRRKKIADFAMTCEQASNYVLARYNQALNWNTVKVRDPLNQT